MREQIINDIVTRCIPEKAYAEQWDTDTLHEEVMRIFGKDLPIAEWAKEEGIADAEIRERISDIGNRLAAGKVADYGADVVRSVEKSLLLQMLDQVWKEHLLTLDQLRQGIGLRAYAQRDPKLEYQREGFALFGEMEQRIDDTLAEYAIKFSFPRPNLAPQATQRRVEPAPASPPPASAVRSAAARTTPTDPNASAGGDSATGGKVGRYEPCPCGSGKEYKKCHGA